MTTQTPDAVREAVALTITDAGYHLRKYRPHCLEALEKALAALDSRAGDAGEGMARHLLDALNDSEELMNGDIVLTADHAKQLNADVDAWEAAEPFSPEDAWDELVNADDRTSPEEYPDMCLITRDELIDFMARATPAPAVDALQAQEEAEDARSTCECEGEGQWEHCGPCSLRFGRAIELRRAALSLTPAVDGEERRPDSTPVPGDARSIDGELCFYRSAGWYPSPVVDVIQVDENGEAMACAGCGTTQALPAIKARAPQALSCCPERKMVPVRSLWAAPAVDAVPAGEVEQ